MKSLVLADRGEGMDLVVVVAAVAFGFAAAQVHLPPFVGYLVAGFALGAFGFESTPVIERSPMSGCCCCYSASG